MCVIFSHFQIYIKICCVFTVFLSHFCLLERRQYRDDKKWEVKEMRMSCKLQHWMLWLCGKHLKPLGRLLSFTFIIFSNLFFSNLLLLCTETICDFISMISIFLSSVMFYTLLWCISSPNRMPSIFYQRCHLNKLSSPWKSSLLYTHKRAAF